MWQVSISTNVEGEEAVSNLLERFFSSPTIYRDEDTGAVLVTAYPKRLPSPLRALRSALAEGLKQIRDCGLNPGKTRVTIKPLPRRNWAESWKRHFKPIKVGAKLLVKPGWIKTAQRPGQKVVILDPGLSFGTGNHPTTLFCLQQIVKCHRAGAKQSFLDIGTGSGILAIAAAKLGYSPVHAFDFDPESVRAAKKNLTRNRAYHSVQLRRADLTRLPLYPRRRYDLVCANLTSDLLLAHAEKIRNLIRPGGKLVIAGVLARDFPDVTAKLHRIHLTLEFSKTMSNWKSGQFVLCNREGS